MRLLRAISLFAFVLITTACASDPVDATRREPSRSPAALEASASASAPPAAILPTADPTVRVEEEARQQCDAQGIAQYPDGFVAARTPGGTIAHWDGDRYRFGYPATVTIPGLTPDAPPIQKLISVTCTLIFEDGHVLVSSWNAT